MILFRILTVSTLIFCLSSGCKPDLKKSALHQKTKVENTTYTGPSLAYKWAEKALDLTASDNERNSPRPTITSRYLALVSVAVFDAWSRYDSNAKPVYLVASNRRPVEEHTLENKEKAISYAAYRTLIAFYPVDSLILKQFMESLGYDPLNTSLNPDTPEGIGNLAGKNCFGSKEK